MAHDSRLMGLSVEAHPLGLLRPALSCQIVPINRLRECRNGAVVQVAGMVTTRQRPETAKGILFLLLEDEGGMVNVVVRPELQAAQRELYRAEPLLVIKGVLERKALRLNLVAQEAWPLTEALPDAAKSAAARRAHDALQGFEAPDAHNFR
jgi:error-prone DNA polymerase